MSVGGLHGLAQLLLPHSLHLCDVILCGGGGLLGMVVLIGIGVDVIRGGG